MLVNSLNSSGIVIPEIGVFRDNPESFFCLHVDPLNSSIALVNSLRFSSSGVRAGNSLTSTALCPYNVLEMWCVKKGHTGESADIRSRTIR